MGALEGAWALAHSSVVLSEKNIIDCSSKLFLKPQCARVTNVTIDWQFLHDCSCKSQGRVGMVGLADLIMPNQEKCHTGHCSDALTGSIKTFESVLILLLAKASRAFYCFVGQEVNS